MKGRLKIIRPEDSKVVIEKNVNAVDVDKFIFQLKKDGYMIEGELSNRDDINIYVTGGRRKFILRFKPSESNIPVSKFPSIEEIKLELTKVKPTK